MNFTHIIATVFSSPISAVILGVLILILLTLVVFVAVIIQFEARFRSLISPEYYRITNVAERKAEKILEEAREQSKAVRTRSGDISEILKKEDEVVLDAQKKQLQESTDHAKELLTKHVATLTQALEAVSVGFKEHTEGMRTTLEAQEEELKKLMGNERENMKKFFSKMEEDTKKEYGALIEDTKKIMSEELEKDIQETRKALEIYRTQRLEVLNSEIVSLVEDTARIALNKIISLEDHKDLVIKALKEAKQKGVFSM